MKNKTFCSVLWNHQMIDTAGNVKPCCRFRMHGTQNSLHKNTLTEIFNSKFMQRLRHDAKNGINILGCQRCYEEQDGGKKSLRERMNSHETATDIDIDNPNITYLELAISNNCNLMCRICSSKFSHKLYDEELTYLGESASTVKHTKSNISCAYESLHNLKYIKFTGGEPLIIKEHWELLEHAIEKDYAKNIILNYSTNCTIWPKKKIIDIWKHFKKIELAVSLDSIMDAENEYQRYLTDQSKVIHNIKKYVELSTTFLNMRVIGRPTISIMNVLHAPETIEWLESNKIKTNPTHLTDPEHQSITVLPLKYKNLIKNKYDSFSYSNDKIRDNCNYILNYMFSQDNSDLIKEFKKHTAFLDSQRNQSFIKTYPYFDF